MNPDPVETAAAADPASPGRNLPESFFRAVIEMANEGIWVIDLAGRTIFANRRMAAMLATTPEEMIGLSPVEFLRDEDQSRAAEIMARSFAGEAVEFEIQFLRRDRAEIAVLAGSAPLRDEDGTITGSIATFSDVTTLKRTEHELLQRTIEFEALAENIPTLCWMARPDGHIDWYNRRWYEYTGAPRETQEGWGWESVHDPAVLPGVVERWKHSLETGEPFEMTFPLKGADGEYRSFLTRVVPIRDGGGGIVRWFGSNTDVTDLKQAEQEVRASEALLARQLAEVNALYESAPIGLGFFDRGYRYLRINEQLAAINGVAAEDHIGRTIREVLSDSAPPVEPIIDQVFRTGEAVRLETAGETPQQPGIVRHWLAGFYPVKNGTGKVEAVGAWVVEITDRKAAEQREVLLAREVDHRAKNLLAVVQSVVQLTRADTTEEFKAAVLGRIQALGRAHSLLADARWDGAGFDDLLKDEFAPYLGDAAGRITTNGPPLLLRPAAAQALAMVIHELATNAAKYGALSVESGRLSVTWTLDGPMIEIRWIEEGGPAAREPATSGFGSQIVKVTIERQLQGELRQQWLPGGLDCTMRISARDALRA